MSRRPLVSIVIDNFNYAAYLRESIDSALRQTYPEVEVIVVDDGSTDDSRAIIAAYGDKVIPVLKENGGQASAFNAGFQTSRGEAVCFLDADDALVPTAIERALPLLDDPRVVKVHWPLWEINAAGERTGKPFPISPLAEGDLRETTIERGPLSYITSPTSGNLWARHYLERVIPVAECGNKHGADAYLSMLAPLYGHIRGIAEPQGLYRIHSRSFSGNKRYKKRTPRLYGIQCRILADHLTRAGVDSDTRLWKKAEYAWEFEMKRAERELREVVPPEAAVIVIDSGQLATGFPRRRKALPFLEKHGRYWGHPPDDATAVGELERMRHQGAEFAAVTWPAFWWLEHYKVFASHLRSRYHLAFESERLIVFDLRNGVPRPGSAMGVSHG
jgi:glycosyltransferase involved in cell wall biosynthesis